MARTLEVVGERWTLLVVRELLSGSTGFNQIRRGIPAIPRDTLSRRLRQLCDAGIVRQHGSGTATSYSPTPAGEALAPLLCELATWSSAWDQRGLQPEHLNPDVLLWDVQRRIDYDAAPERAIIEFVLNDRPAADRRLWLLINCGEAEVCRSDGGYETDVTIEASTEALSLWWLGQLDWSAALRSEEIVIQATSLHRASFPHWFLGYALLAQAGE